MAERIVPANDIFITIALDGQSQQVVYCVVSITRNYTTNIIDSASICNPVSKTPGTQDFSVDVSLQRYWDTAVNHYSEQFLHDAMMNKSLIDYTVGPATPVATDLVETGSGYITSMTKTDAANEPATMDITITLSDAPVLTEVP